MSVEKIIVENPYDCPFCSHCRRCIHFRDNAMKIEIDNVVCHRAAVCARNNFMFDTVDLSYAFAKLPCPYFKHR